MPSFHYKHPVQFRALLGLYLSLHITYSRTSFLFCQTDYKCLLPWANRFLWMSCRFDHWILSAFCFWNLAQLFKYVVAPQSFRLEEHLINHCCFEFCFHHSSFHEDMTCLSLKYAYFFHSREYFQADSLTGSMNLAELESSTDRFTRYLICLVHLGLILEQCSRQLVMPQGLCYWLSFLELHRPLILEWLQPNPFDHSLSKDLFYLYYFSLFKMILMGELELFLNLSHFHYRYCCSYWQVPSWETFYSFMKYSFS